MTNAPTEIEKIEEWILSKAGDRTADATAMRQALQRLAEAMGTDRADACAELWQEELLNRTQADELIELLRLRAAWHGRPEFKETCRNVLEVCFNTDVFNRALLQHAGFDQRLLATAEPLQRLQRLRAMHPGDCCYDKTWGAGRIREVSDFHCQVTVDFKTKPGHRLSLAHAAANLRVLPPENILARSLLEPERLQLELAEHPDLAVREILRDFGPLSVVRLQEWTTTHLLPAENWKKFWDAARKILKQDPLVTLPGRRNEPISMRSCHPAEDPAWRQDFSRECEIGRIFQGCEEIRTTAGLPPPDRELAAILQDRLLFILQSAGRRENTARARALLLGLETGMAPDNSKIIAQAELLLQPDVFREVLADLPARSQGAFCEILRQIHPQRATELFIAGIAEFDLGSLNEVLRHLEARQDGDTVAVRMRGLLQAETPPMEIIAWLCRNPGFREKHGLLADGRLAFSVLTLLENPGMAGVGRTRCRNQLRDSLANPAWLEQACREMNEQQRRDFALRLKNVAPGLGIDNMALLMRLVKLHPELEDVLAETAPAAAPARLTSLRSYQDRQAALHKLINEDIPNNSRDIGIARSYGDLRENFEYKSAKETQGILMRRRAELEQLLGEIRATDFENFPTDRAGPGTTVTLQYADGTGETFVILGEWDHNESLGIIPMRSRMAELLLGQAAGAQIEVPAADGNLRPAVITKIEAFGPDVKRWIHGQLE